MTNEEFERHVEFTLQQQAKFDAEMRELKAAQAQTSKKLDQAAEMLTTLIPLTFDGFKVLSDSQKLTDEALRKLIIRFDRHLGEDHGLEN